MKNTPSQKRILIVVAHPDDEVLGCGGTIAKYSNSNDIYVVILGEGITSRNSKRIKTRNKSELAELQKQSRQAGKLLGVKENIFFNLPDNRFDTIPLLDIVKKIEKVVKKINPETVYTHFGGDLNIDHRITFQATLTATRPIGDNIVRELYSFEILSSTEWGYGKIKRQFNPNVYENISESINKKIEAMRIYQGELNEFPHPRSLKGIKTLAQKRGMEVGLEYAEAFELIRWIK